MLAAAMLHDDAHELLGEPVGLVETRQCIAERALDLAALERDLDLVAGLVARDDLELVAEDVLQHDRAIDAKAADTGAAHDELSRLRLRERLHRRSVPDIAHV